MAAFPQNCSSPQEGSSKVDMDQQEFSLSAGDSVLVPEQTRSVHTLFRAHLQTTPPARSNVQSFAQLPVAETAGDRRLVRVPKSGAEETLNIANGRQGWKTFGEQSGRGSDGCRHVWDHRTMSECESIDP